MSKPKASPDPLSRRERQVMNIIYEKGQATATDIHESLPDRPTFSATRAIIRTLEEKGHIRHEEQGLRYIYLPVVSPDKAKRSALAHVVSTFFSGSASSLMATLLESSTGNLTDDELEELEKMIQRAKKEKPKQ
jgi:BlaI family transcriptional regulator, penicillinase repressor